MEGGGYCDEGEGLSERRVEGGWGGGGVTCHRKKCVEMVSGITDLKGGRLLLCEVLLGTTLCCRFWQRHSRSVVSGHVKQFKLPGVRDTE